jgi:21S rRNA (uridine2791-2'-O)-methyltransferase
MALTTAHLEKEFYHVHAHTVQILDTERARVQRMEQLLLRIENDNLQLQLNQAGLDLIQAKEAESDIRLELDRAIREFDLLKDVAQASSREIDNLRHELASLSAIASDTQKLQAEKVRLTKEVSSIRSEVDELRSQNTSANALLAENQAITRQLNATKIELENEKRAHERALAKQAQQKEDVGALTTKLEVARQELELARRHGHYNTRQKNSTPSVSGENRGTDKNMVALKDRHLEDTPVQQQEDWGTTTTIKVPTERAAESHPRNFTNRSELTIATPGAVCAQTQQKPFSTLPGDKSAFSITPFLNRTTELDDSSMSSDDELNEASNTGKDGHGANTITFPKQLKSPIAKQPNKLAKQAPAKASVKGDTGNGQKQMILDSPDVDRINQSSLSRPVGQKQAPSKKRKLGLQRDRNLFDEDEDDNTFHETRKPGRKLVGTGQTGLVGKRVFTGPIGFSPLKRDRKPL